MPKKITPKELAGQINEILSLRNWDIDPNLPNLRFCGTLEQCSEGAVCLRYRTYSWMANPNRVVHGGMVSAILDTSMGTVCCALYEGGFTPTITMTTNYARPVPLDADIIVKVRYSYTGSTSAQLSAELILAEAPDIILATATGVYHTGKTDTLKLKDLLPD